MKNIILILVLPLVGCGSLEQQPKFEPLPPEKLHDLLHISDTLAYKSITIKDYTEPEEVN